MSEESFILEIRHLASYDDHLDSDSKYPSDMILKLLKENEPIDYNKAIEVDGDTILHVIMENRFLDCVKYILQSQNQKCFDFVVDISIKNNDGDTPLYLAAWTYANECIKLLINYAINLGMDIPKLINVKNNGGHTILHVAILKSNIELIELLLNLGVDTNVRDLNGFLPIDMTNSESIKAIIRGHQELPS